MQSQRFLLWGVLICLLTLGVWGCPEAPKPDGVPDAAADGVVTPDKKPPDDRTIDAKPPKDDTTPDVQEVGPGDAAGPEEPVPEPPLPDGPAPDTVPNPTALLLLEDGNYQRGEVGKPLLKPLTIRYVDRFERGVEGIEVVFTVLGGGGTLDGGKASVTVKTDKEGRASALLSLGDEQGFQRQIVQVQKKADTSRTITFVASGFVAGPPENTAFSGVVIDNKAQPLAGVEVFLVKNNKKSPVVKTDKDGRYTIPSLKDFVGQSHLVIDGTKEPSKDLYPKLEYEVFNIAGIDNRLDGPASLPKLDPAGSVQIDEKKSAEIKPSSVPELRMAIAAGSVTFSDKKKSGSVNITKVDPYWVPMPPPNGYASSTIVTIQPSDVRFDPPAPITFPNTDKIPAGKLVPIMSFDHAKGRYVKIATGRVSADGKSIASLPGEGIVRGGWHFTSQLSQTSTTTTNVTKDDKDDVNDELDETNDNKRFVKSKTQTTGCTKKAGDPISLCGGALTLASTDLSVRSRGLSFRFTRTYNSKIRFHGPLGHGWDHSYNMRLLIKGNGDAEFVNGGGRGDTFTWDAAKKTFASPPNNYTQLIKLANGNYVLKWRGGMLGTFDSQGVLRKLEDRFGNTMQFAYNLKGQLSRVTDSVGRHFEYSYDERGHLTRLTDFAGRTVSFTYDKEDNLTEVTTPATSAFPKGKTVKYTYSSGKTAKELNHNLLTITDAKGQTYATNKYDTEDRVSEQVYGRGTFKVSYQEVNKNGDAKDLALVRHITTMTDPEGNVVKYHFNINGNAVKTEQISRKLRPTDPASWVQTVTYNKEGRPLQITYPNGNSVTYTYDTSSTNPLDRGNVLSMEWKSHRAQDAHKSITTKYTYESRYQLRKTYIGPRGNCTGCDPKKYTTTLFYDYEEKSAGDLNGDGKTSGDKGFLVKIVGPTATLPDGKKQPREWKFVPNAFGQTVKRIDALGIVTDYEYFGPNGTGNPFDGEGYLKKVTKDPGNLKITSSYLYDNLGNLKSYTDPRGNTWRYLYNARNQLLAKIAPAPFLYKTFYTYDANDNVTLVQYENKGHDNKQIPEQPYLQTKFIYNILDRVSEIQREISAGKWLVTKMERDKLERVTKVIKPEGNANCVAYDERSLPLSRTYGCGAAEALKFTYRFDKNRNLVETKLPGGETYQRFYDGYNRVIRSLDPVGSSVNYTYDRASHRISAIRRGDHGGKKDVLLAQRVLEVDEVGRVSKQIAHLFNTPGSTVKKLTTQLFYDANGALTRMVNPLGNSWRWTYDSAHRMSGRTDPLGNGVQLKRDAGGLVTQKTVLSKSTQAGVNDRSYVIDYTNDAMGRLTSRKNALGYQLQFSYNSRGYLARRVDQEGEVFHRSYDALGRPLTARRILRSAGKVVGEQITKYAWSGNGNLTSITTPRGNVYTRRYDKLDRLIASFRPAVKGTTAQTTLTYDNNGRVKTATYPNGTVKTSTYDAASRLTKLAIKLATGGVGATTKDFAYDGLHRLVEAKNNFSTVKLERDSLGRLLSDKRDGVGMEAKYDDAGNLTNIKFPSGKELRYTYGKANHMSSVLWVGQTKPVAVWEYVGNTAVRKTLASGVTMERTLDAVGRIATQGYFNAAKKALKGYRYFYNKANRIVAKQALATSGADVYQLNSRYLLASVGYGIQDPQKELATPGSQTAGQRVKYTYDLDNNRTSVTPTGTTPAFPVLYTGAYQTDARGDYTKIGANTVTQDPSGNTINLGPNGFGYNGDNQISVLKLPGNIEQKKEYDALNRLSKQVNTNGSFKDTSYINFGGLVFGVNFDKDKTTQSNALGHRGEIVATQQGSLSRDVATDLMKSPVAFLLPSGAVEQQMDYSPNGVVVVKDPSGKPGSSSAINFVFSFQGQADNTNGLSLGNNGLSPQLGRSLPNNSTRAVPGQGDDYMQRDDNGDIVYVGPMGLPGNGLREILTQDQFAQRLHVANYGLFKPLRDDLPPMKPSEARLLADQIEMNAKYYHSMGIYTPADLEAHNEKIKKERQAKEQTKPDPVVTPLHVGPCPDDIVLVQSAGGESVDSKPPSTGTPQQIQPPISSQAPEPPQTPRKPFKKVDSDEFALAFASALAGLDSQNRDNGRVFFSSKLKQSNPERYQFLEGVNQVIKNYLRERNHTAYQERLYRRQQHIKKYGWDEPEELGDGEEIL